MKTKSKSGLMSFYVFVFVVNFLGGGGGKGVSEAGFEEKVHN